MPKYTRGEFLALTTGIAAFSAGLARTPAPAVATAERASEAELIVLNARVLTSDERLPGAEAFAVREGRFVAVGQSHDISNLKSARTRVIDATGRTVVPGFIDAHTHPAWGGIEQLVSVNLDLRSIAEIKEALRARAAVTPPGEWVRGYKYDDTKTREGRRLRREDLDEAAPDHPVQVKHRGGHINWFNSRAFGLAGVTIHTPDPPGGRFVRRDGELDGAVANRALEAFRRVLPASATPAQYQEGVVLIARSMAAAGLTSVHEAECSPAFLAAYQDAYQAGDLPFRVYVLVQGYAPIYEALKAGGVRGGIGDEWLRIGGAKWLADGSAQERTMRMSTPYVGRPDDYGLLTMSQEEIDQAAEDADAHGFQVGIHANGDVAIDMVMKAYERILARGPRRTPYRPRIEHCSLVNPDLLARIRRTGAVPTPFATYVHYHGDKWAEYGEERMQWMFAHRSFLEYGIRVPGASDYIPGPYEPLMALQSLVTRKDLAGRVWGPGQRITVDEALRVYTINGAYASGEEHLKGSITPGKFADFVVLEKDPHDVDPDEIQHITVVQTVIGGKSVHSLE